LLRYGFKYTSPIWPLFLLVTIACNAEPFAEAVARLWSRPKGRGGVLLTGLGGAVIIFVALTFSPVYAGFEAPLFQSVRTIGIGAGGILYILGINQLARLRLRAPLDSAGRASVAGSTAGPRRAKWVALGIMCLVLILSYGLRMHPLPVMAAGQQAILYETISTLPKDTLLAGDPLIMSNVPPFSKRSVLFSKEITDAADNRILDFFDAYYAESPETVVSFCQQYGVDYLVVNERDFAPDYIAAGQFFYAPFNEAIAEMASGRSGFVLSRVPDDRKLVQSGDLFLIPCEAHVFQ
jgi:hypothetical protein